MKSEIKAELLQEWDLKLDYSKDCEIMRERLKRIDENIKKLEERQK